MILHSRKEVLGSRTQERVPVTSLFLSILLCPGELSAKSFLKITELPFQFNLSRGWIVFFWLHSYHVRPWPVILSPWVSVFPWMASTGKSPVLLNIDHGINSWYNDLRSLNCQQGTACPASPQVHLEMTIPEPCRLAGLWGLWHQADSSWTQWL